MEEKELSHLVEEVIRKTMGTKNAETPELTDMTLRLARILSEKVRQKASAMGVQAVVAVSNRAARPVLVECMDDSYIASYDVALNKAYTVVALKMPTTDLKTLCQPGGPLYGIELTNGGQIVIFGGGVPLRLGGRLIGGLGVSGGTEEQDTALAEFGASVLEEAAACL